MEPVPLILFVDDNPGDSELVEEAFRQYEVPATFTKVSSGPLALSLLRQAVDQHLPLPDLILLDLNLPMMSGHEILARIRADPDLAHLEVVMLSSSERGRDIEKAEALAASSYVIKPSNWEEYLVLVRGFQQRLKRRSESLLQPPAPLKGLESSSEAATAPSAPLPTDP